MKLVLSFLFELWPVENFDISTCQVDQMPISRSQEPFDSRPNLLSPPARNHYIIVCAEVAVVVAMLV